MTADFASNISMMMALNNFTNGQYKYQYPTITTSSGSYVDPSGMSSIFNHAVAMANAANMGNYTGGLNGNFADISLSTPAWLQQVGEAATSSLNLNFNQSLMNPFASTSTTTTNPFAQSGSAPVVDDLAEQNDYEKTAKAGIYKKDDKYYKYDFSKNAFVEASESEANAAKRADTKKAEEDAKTKRKEKAANERKAGTIAADIFDAIDGAGTNDSKLSEAVKSITKDNVIEAFDKWIDKGYEKEFGNEGGLIASIQDDVSGDDQDEYENHIADALYDRAIDLDLVEEAEEFRSDIESIRLTKGRGSSKDKALNEKFNEIVKLIKEKENEAA